MNFPIVNLLHQCNQSSQKGARNSDSTALPWGWIGASWWISGCRSTPSRLWTSRGRSGSLCESSQCQEENGFHVVRKGIYGGGAVSYTGGELPRTIGCYSIY
jgi:hypothetical protein